MEKTEDSVTSSLDEILSVIDIEYSVIPGFEKGKTIRLVSLTAGDLIEWSEAGEGDAKRTAGLRLICKAVVDNKGKRYLADEDKVVPVLRMRQHKTTERIVREILKMNGLEVKGAEKVEEKAKNV